MCRNILVTGGAGYIGSHTCKLLHRQGYRVYVLDNLVYGHREFVKWGELIEGDLKDHGKLEKLFSNRNFDGVVHFAAYAYVGESVKDPEKYYRNNVANTLNLLDVMRRSSCRNIVFSSSCATYGVPKELPIGETSPQAPINPYGNSKKIVESMLFDFDVAYGVKHVSLRYFNAAGADADGELGEWHDPETHLIPLAIEAALGRRECLSVFGDDYDTKDGTAVRDYIHVEDLAQAHLLALQHLESGGDSMTFNLANGKGYSIKDVIDCVEAVTGCTIPIRIEKRRDGDPAVLVGDSRLIAKSLGWEPRHDLASIVRSAVRWHRESL